MKILIKSRHIEIPSEIKQAIEQKIQKALKNIKGDVIEVNVEVTGEKSREAIEINVLTNYTTFRCMEETHDLQLSVDRALDVLERQIRKNKGRFRDKRRKHKSERFDTSELQEDTDDHLGISDDEIVKTNKFASKPMSIYEASMQLKLSDDHFLVFANSQTNEVNVLYKRKDGKIGHIEPDF